MDSPESINTSIHTFTKQIQTAHRKATERTKRVRIHFLQMSKTFCEKNVKLGHFGSSLGALRLEKQLRECKKVLKTALINHHRSEFEKRMKEIGSDHSRIGLFKLQKALRLVPKTATAIRGRDISEGQQTYFFSDQAKPEFFSRHARREVS